MKSLRVFKLIFGLVVLVVLVYPGFEYWGDEGVVLAQIGCIVPACGGSGSWVSQSSCQSSLGASGFTNIEVVGEFSDSVPSGDVDYTTPSQGTVASCSEQVQVYVSEGSLTAAGTTIFSTAFNGILTFFAFGLFVGMFIKLTNRS